ncbi:MAG: molybdopterin-guanine dinucleotide biosynthesis protein A [Candidatus Omnitrophota bacterium]|jgi:molybdopterin-guanine dinucleotide biosynthesis protein A
MTSLIGVVLAGGKSRRFGSNKALAEFNGKPLIQQSLGLLKSLGFKSCISTSSVNDYTALGYPLIRDLYPDTGPLGALYSALVFTKNPILVLTCDMPSITIASLQELINKFKERRNSVTLYQRADGQLQPFPGIYALNCLPLIKQSLSINKLAMRDFLDRINSKYALDSEHKKAEFKNINYKTDLID